MGYGAFLLKNIVLLLMLLIVCKFSVFFFIFKGGKGGHGFRVINLYLLDRSRALIGICTH